MNNKSGFLVPDTRESTAAGGSRRISGYQRKANASGRYFITRTCPGNCLSLAFFCVILIFVFSSCVSFNITSRAYTQKGFSLKKTERLFLEPMIITSYNFMDEQEIAYILNKKLHLALLESGLSLCSDKKSADMVIHTELIIKPYQQEYQDKNYYLLAVRCVSMKNKMWESIYEYNGSASIFNSRVQNALFSQFIKDFSKLIES
ncbi:MAG: hypothetical protein ACOC7U_08960 [Spirochaetota bacterium]